MVAIIISGITLALAIILFIAMKKLPLSTRFLGPGIILLIGIFILIRSLVVIDAGEAGAVVIFGKVQDDYLSSGIHSVVPWATVVTYPQRIQTFTAEGPDNIDILSKDGLSVGIDISVRYTVDATRVPDIYRNIAKNMDELRTNIFLPEVRSAVRSAAAQYTPEEAYSSARDQLAADILTILKAKLDPKGVIVQEVLIRGIDLPDQITNAIQTKLAKEQEAFQKEFEKSIAQKDAEIKLIEAQALAEAQRIINTSLSSFYLQHEAIQAYKDLANSDNTTFIIMPTSPEGAGMPLIVNGN